MLVGMRKRQALPADFDSPLEGGAGLFPDAVSAVVFAQVHTGIDWAKGYEALDKALHQIARRGQSSNALADMVFTSGTSMARRPGCPEPSRKKGQAPLPEGHRSPRPESPPSDSTCQKRACCGGTFAHLLRDTRIKGGRSPGQRILAPELTQQAPACQHPASPPLGELLIDESPQDGFS
jgi:hypothetical protein